MVVVSASTYIDAMVDRYLDGDASACKERPTTWGFAPADDALNRAYEAAIIHRTPAPQKLFKEYNSLVGSLRHVVKHACANAYARACAYAHAYAHARACCR